MRLCESEAPHPQHTQIIFSFLQIDLPLLKPVLRTNAAQRSSSASGRRRGEVLTTASAPPSASNSANDEARSRVTAAVTEVSGAKAVSSSRCHDLTLRAALWPSQSKAKQRKKQAVREKNSKKKRNFKESFQRKVGSGGGGVGGTRPGKAMRLAASALAVKRPARRTETKSPPPF